MPEAVLPPADDEFAGLVLRYLDGLTTDEENRRLSEGLGAPEGRDLFVALCRQRGILTEALGAQRVSEAFQDRSSLPSGRRRRSARITRAKAGGSRRAYGLAAAIAAGFLVVVILSSIVPDRPIRPMPPPQLPIQAKAPVVPTVGPKPAVKKQTPAPVRPTQIPRRTPPAPPKVSAPALPPNAPPAAKPPAPETPKPPPTPHPNPRPTATTLALARVDRVAGQASSIPGDRLRVGAVLEAGRGVRTTGAGSSLTLAYEDGSRVEIGADTIVGRLEIEKGKEIHLTTGTVAVEAAKQPKGRPMTLKTPHAEVRVLGTRFTLRVTPTSTRLDVSEGRVRFSRASDGAALEVGGGHYAVAGAASPFEAAAIPRSKPPILLVVGARVLNPGDRAVKARLERLGHTVVVKADVDTTAADATGMALVVLSSTSGSTTIGRAFRGLAVPVMTWEAWLYDDLGMTGPGRLKDYGNLPGEQSELLILSPSHPMAAGRSMKVTVSPPLDLMWGRPNANAIVIAVLAKNPSRAAHFGYEKGARMPGGLAAPARRVGFFLPDNTPDVLTDDGWALFDAAVTWGAEVRPARRR